MMVYVLNTLGTEDGEDLMYTSVHQTFEGAMKGAAEAFTDQFGGMGEEDFEAVKATLGELGRWVKGIPTQDWWVFELPKWGLKFDLSYLEVK